MDCQILLDNSPRIIVQIKLESRRLVRPLGHRDPVLVVVLIEEEHQWWSKKVARNYLQLITSSVHHA